MKTVLLYYSSHHGNTKKLLDAIKASDDTVALIDITACEKADLGGYETIGIASGIYGANFSQSMLRFAEENLPEGKNVFFLFTSGLNLKGFTKNIRKITDAKNCTVLGQYGCTGYDTFGPFRLIGGVRKGHPDQEEIAGAVAFYHSLNKETPRE